MSFSLDSCTPEPVCESKVYAMNSLDRVADISKYLGDPKTADWVSQGEPVVYDGKVLLTMPAHSVGTVMASTTYMWYGNVKATLKTSRGAGVVTAFILLSDVKDEIDYEYVGTELDVAQTNYYFQGIPDCKLAPSLPVWLQPGTGLTMPPQDDNSANISLSDTYANFHTYEMQWTPDSITWLVDGKVGRVKKRSDTWNKTSNQWDFPQTPARVQLSIWPGGASTNAKGTIDWAGGPIDWDNAPDIKEHGYYYATFGPVEVQCYNASKAPGTNTDVSYTYSAASGLNNSVVDGGKPTALKSFLGTGTDMDAGAASSATPDNNNNGTAATVPGGSTGVGSHPGEAGDDAGGGGGSGGGSATNTVPAACATAGFSQNCGGSSSATDGSKSDGVRGADRGLGASAFAVVVGVGVLVVF